MAIRTGGGSVRQVLVDSKGDMFVATGDDTVARLAVGSDGTVLTANSGAAGGVSWNALSVDTTSIAVMDIMDAQ